MKLCEDGHCMSSNETLYANIIFNKNYLIYFKLSFNSFKSLSFIFLQHNVGKFSNTVS